MAKSKLVQILNCFSYGLENIVGKGENAGNNVFKSFCFPEDCVEIG